MNIRKYIFFNFRFSYQISLHSGYYDIMTNNEEKISDETLDITTPPSITKRIDNAFGELVLPTINIIKYGYKTTEKRPFELST